MSTKIHIKINIHTRIHIKIFHCKLGKYQLIVIDLLKQKLSLFVIRSSEKQFLMSIVFRC